MRVMRTREVAEPVSQGPRFFSVREVAAVLGVDDMTVYRAISARQFPAIKIRGRYVVPARVLDSMEADALAGMTVVDSATWLSQRTDNPLINNGDLR